MLCFIGFARLRFQVGVFAKECKCFLIVLMGVKIKAQFQKHKFKGLKFRHLGAKHFDGFRFDLERQVQAGEQGAVCQGLLLGISFRVVLLKRHIGDGQRRALRQYAAAVVAGAGIVLLVVLGIQGVSLLLWIGTGREPRPSYPMRNVVKRPLPNWAGAWSQDNFTFATMTFTEAGASNATRGAWRSWGQTI